MGDRPRILTFPQACTELQLSTKTLRAIIASGKLKAAKVGATWRIRSDDIDAYLEAALWRSTDAENSGTTTSRETATVTADRRACAIRKQRAPLRIVSVNERPWERPLAKA